MAPPNRREKLPRAAACNPHPHPAECHPASLAPDKSRIRQSQIRQLMPQLDKINLCSNDAFLCKNEIFFDHCISAAYTSAEKNHSGSRPANERSSATGRDTMERFLDFLIGHFTFLGFEFQYWMPIVIGAVAIYLLNLWRTGQL